MNTIKEILSTTILLIIFGCGANKTITKLPGIVENPPIVNNPYTMPDSTMVYFENDDGSSLYNPMSSSATYIIGSDTNRKFIKTADVKFRVNSVVRATYEIEDITRKFGGFVMHTMLDSRIDNTTVIPVSRDSSLETVYYTVINSMTIRVPEKKLDSILRSFTPLVTYLDHRTIEVEDVYLKLLANQLTRQRVKSHQDRTKKNIDSKGKKLSEINESEEMLYNKQEQADNAKIESLLLKDKMEFSTVTLYIYQRQAIKKELIFNGKNVEAYEPGFGYKMKRSLRNGWKDFQEIILFFAQFWVFILFVIIGLIIIIKLTKVKSK